MGSIMKRTFFVLAFGLSLAALARTSAQEPGKKLPPASEGVTIEQDVGYAEGVKETSVRLSIRSRNDGEWSAWREIERGTAIKVDRLIQLRCQLESSNPRLSPRVNRVIIH